MTEQRDEFTEWLDAQSVERIEAAMRRAQRRDTEFWDDESFEAVLMEEVYTLYTADCTRDLVDRGYATASVLDNGDLGFKITEAGREYVDAPD